MDGPLIYLAMDNAKIIINILKAVHFRDLATIFATNNGIKVTVEDSKCIQGNAFLHSALFREYSVKKDIISFRTNLGVLVDCLSIFGTSVQGPSVSFILSYKTHGSALNILLEENGVVAECNIKTMEAFEILDFDFSSSNISDKFIMKVSPKLTVMPMICYVIDVINTSHLSFLTYIKDIMPDTNVYQNFVPYINTCVNVSALSGDQQEIEIVHTVVENENDAKPRM
ncbi:unnamed protein product [Schistosoma curassoni]|uniref:Cell cycle checkpoint protein RAD1 n=1 Tax=Schistosoma curassoni TaxID=6186 RepID=A0A183KZS6_9TREM|nr:unnamed protein product [Schistosoma curassoni]